MGEYLFNDCQLFNAVKHFDAAAGTADIDIDYPLEVSPPGAIVGDSLLSIMRQGVFINQIK